MCGIAEHTNCKGDCVTLMLCPSRNCHVVSRCIEVVVLDVGQYT